MAIDSISIIPVVKGFSDHDVQLLSLNNSKSCSHTKRQINNASIDNFRLKLSYETWKELFL
jgi:hypothetical protein